MIHHIFSGHEVYAKPDVGYFVLCYWRVVGKIREIWFRIPDQNANWTAIPDMETAYKIMECDSYFEAMAVLRAAQAKT